MVDSLVWILVKQIVEISTTNSVDNSAEFSSENCLIIWQIILVENSADNSGGVSVGSIARQIDENSAKSLVARATNPTDNVADKTAKHLVEYPWRFAEVKSVPTQPHSFVSNLEDTSIHTYFCQYPSAIRTNRAFLGDVQIYRQTQAHCKHG